MSAGTEITGRHTAWLVEAGARITAVDFSAAMLEQARKRVATSDVRFVTHDLHEPLPFGTHRSMRW